MWRALRHAVLDGLTAAALRGAPHAPTLLPTWVARLTAAIGPWCPRLASNVARNMRALGVYTPQAHREYFRQVAGHLAGALQALSCAGRQVAEARCRLAGVAGRQVELDESVARLQRAVERGRGVVLVGPHVVNYLLNLTRLNQVVPVTVYLRHSKSARRQAAKERWYEASGVQWICAPGDQRRPLARLSRMAAAVHAGSVLFVTPDLPRKAESGLPVRLFDRVVFLPQGAALLAVWTGAPLFMLTAERCAAGQRLIVRGPAQPIANGRGREHRRATVQQYMQWFADGFQQFLVEQTPLWYLWGDKRWTQLLSGDPRYGRQWIDRDRGVAAAGGDGGI